MVSNKILVVIIIVIVAFVIFKTSCILWCCYKRRFTKFRSRLLDSSSSTASKNSERSAQLLEKLNKMEMDCSDVSMMRRPDGSIWELGSGGFGRVVKGMRAGVQEVAIKMLFQTDQKAQEAFLQEISMLKFVSRDRNIVQFFGASVREDRVWLITELMEGGDLRRALAADEPERVTWWKGGKRIAVDVARGLAFLHSNHVIHRDLKSKNILLTKNLDMAKIGDWGMAKIMSEAYYTQDTGVGTFAWAAPEMLLGEKCTEKVDIYSFGICLWEIATGQLPMRGHITVPSEEECPSSLRELIQDCMQRDPSKRPSATEVFRRLRMCEPNPEIISVESDGSQLSSQSEALIKANSNSGTWTADINSTQSPWTSGELTPSSPTTVLSRYQAEMFADDSMQLGFLANEASRKLSLAKPQLTVLDESPRSEKGDNPEDSVFLGRLANDASAKLTVIEARQRPVPAAEMPSHIPAHLRFMGNLRNYLQISPGASKTAPQQSTPQQTPVGTTQQAVASRQPEMQPTPKRLQFDPANGAQAPAPIAAPPTQAAGTPSQWSRAVNAHSGRSAQAARANPMLQPAALEDKGIDPKSYETPNFRVTSEKEAAGQANGIDIARISRSELHPSWVEGGDPPNEVRLDVRP